MKYYLFIDECGDHNLKNYDPNFPVFTLCGVLVDQCNLNRLNMRFESLKQDVFGSKEIVIHSVDMRKWRGVFSVLCEDRLRRRFFEGIEEILGELSVYTIISCTILKDKLDRFCVRGEEEDVYGVSLEYLIERSIFAIDNVGESEAGDTDLVLTVVVERRGKKEDKRLLDYYNRLRNRGTKWVDSERLRLRVGEFKFKQKKDNIIGLQIADLIAYPITIKLLYPDRSNPSYAVVEKNIFRQDGRMLGQKVIPNKKEQSKDCSFRPGETDP